MGERETEKALQKEKLSRKNAKKRSRQNNPAKNIYVC